jgi:hypothetical protein
VASESLEEQGIKSVMSSIFISYRRVGALVHARALFERLRHEFGTNEVFIDLEGVDYGLDFVDILNEQLNGCQVMLAMIDPLWATAVDRQGRRRIDRENDYVRTEIVTALSRGIRTVPVLIEGAEMPDASDLPEPLRPLTRRNALILDFNRFDAETSRLIGVIRKLLPAPAGVQLAPDLVKKQELELQEKAADASLVHQKEERQAGNTELSSVVQQTEGRQAPDAPKVAATFSVSAPAAEPSLAAPNRRAAIKRRAAFGVGALLLAGSLLFFLVRWVNRNDLTPPPRGIVRSMAPEFIVGQYFGQPLILATLRVENTSTSTTNITDIRGTLTGENHFFVVAPMSWTITNSYGPFEPVTGPIPILAGAMINLRVVMVTGANFSDLYSKTSALPEYKTQFPCVPKPNGAPDPMTPDGFALAKAFAEEHFGWSAGDWKLQVDVTTENGSTRFTRPFSLSPSEIGHLHSSIILIKQCLTVTTTSPLAQDSTLSNFLSK